MIPIIQCLYDKNGEIITIGASSYAQWQLIHLTFSKVNVLGAFETWELYDVLWLSTSHKLSVKTHMNKPVYLKCNVSVYNTTSNG